MKNDITVPSGDIQYIFLLITLTICPKHIKYPRTLITLVQLTVQSGQHGFSQNQGEALPWD